MKAQPPWPHNQRRYCPECYRPVHDGECERPFAFPGWNAPHEDPIPEPSTKGCAVSHPHSATNRCPGSKPMTDHTDNTGPADVITCRSCGRNLDRGDAVCAAGPGVTAWFCRDVNACVRPITNGEAGRG